MNKKGFTLVEMLTSIAVLLIVIVIATLSVVAIYKSIKNKALEEKIEVIEKAAVLFGDAQKNQVVESTYVYKDTIPCISIKISELVPTYLENECKNNSQNEICVIDPRNKSSYLNDLEIIIFYKNKRINSVVDINDELECENTKNEIIIKDFYLEDGITEYVNKRDVNATITWENEKVRYYCLTEKDDSTSCIWLETNGTSITTKYLLSENDGEKIVYAFLKDKFGNISPSKNDKIILDTTKPTGDIVINNDETYTTSKTVTLTLSATGANKMCISNTTSCSDWETYATQKDWTLTDGDGEKTVYVRYKDEAGNISPSKNDKIILDTTKPTGSIKINDDKEYTTSKTVTLTLSATGANKMCISNTTSCSDWETYATQKEWTLTDGDGEKTVYVRYKDEAGNISSRKNDKIILDATKPTVIASAVNNNTDTPKIKFTSNETGEYCINTSSSRTNMKNCVFSGDATADTAKTTSSVTETNTYYVHVKDAAGNIGISKGVNLTRRLVFGEYLINKKTTGWKTSPTNGLYRYAGTNANNYVKLDSILYRVVGVVSENDNDLGLEKYQVKLIKAADIGKQKIHKISYGNVSWDESELSKYLQSSSVLGNTNIIPSSWKSKIDSVKWYTGNVTTYIGTKTISQEKTKITSTSSKIALMYLSDVNLAYINSVDTDCNGYSCNSWLWPSSGNVWTMTSYGVGEDADDGLFSMYYMRSNSYGQNTYFGRSSSELLIYPTFYLLKTVYYTSGSGTSTDPFIIE